MKYISMLRGINVGGRRTVRMDELKALYISLGLKNVSTFIQSGNVMFESEPSSSEDLISIIERAIEEKFEFFVPVIIRTVDEMEDIIKNCPFYNIDLKKDGSKIAVTFLSSAPDKNKLNELKDYLKSGEEIEYRLKEIYLSCPAGFGKTKLTNDVIEKRLSVYTTTRNWRSVNKIFDLINH